MLNLFINKHKGCQLLFICLRQVSSPLFSPMGNFIDTCIFFVQIQGINNKNFGHKKPWPLDKPGNFNYIELCVSVRNYFETDFTGSFFSLSVDDEATTLGSLEAD